MSTYTETVGGSDVARYVLVKTTGAVVVTAGSTDNPLGVTIQSAATGEKVTIGVGGKFFCTAGAAIAKGANIMPDTAGGKVITHTATNVLVGKALQAASADGDIIECELRAAFDVSP